MDITHANLADLNTAFTTAFNERLTGTETTYGLIAMTVNSTTRQQTYPRLQDLPGMREWIGERFINRLETDGFTIRNRKFENTVLSLLVFAGIYLMVSLTASILREQVTA